MLIRSSTLRGSCDIFFGSTQACDWSRCGCFVVVVAAVIVAIGLTIVAIGLGIVAVGLIFAAIGLIIVAIDLNWSYCSYWSSCCCY